MAFSVGIIGLPNVGKSTLFKALTKKQVAIAPYPFTTINPNYGICPVPDERLEKLAKIVKPGKVTPTIIEFIDIAGLVKGAHKGQGLGNQFLAQIRNCDEILEIVRVFSNPKIEHVEKEINPIRDIEIIKVELLMKDLETLENALEKIEKGKKDQKKLEILKRIREEIVRGNLISKLDLTEEGKVKIKEFQFLTLKPKIYVFNTDDTYRIEEIEKYLGSGEKYLFFNLKLEEEISQLTGEEIREMKLKSQLDQLILACYNILDLITFYTVAGGKEVRAWTIKKGAKAPEAGGIVHSDFEKKFIRAEVIPWQKLVEAGSWLKARETGWLKIVGKDYYLKDGDIIEFKI